MENYSRVIQKSAKDPDTIILTEQSAVKTFQHTKKDLTIVLAGASHFGERKYFLKIYEKLNSLDKVLYEEASKGQIDEETMRTEEYQKLEELPPLQEEFVKRIGLCSQKHFIDDKMGKNWEHCDLLLKEQIDMFQKYPDEFTALMQWKEKMKNDIAILRLYPSQRDEILESSMRGVKNYLGLSLEEILERHPFTIKLRNQKVKARIKELVDEGRVKTLGVLYGSFHMLDLENCIRSLDFIKTNTEWYDVFSIKKVLNYLIF